MQYYIILIIIVHWDVLTGDHYIYIYIFILFYKD